MARIEQHGKNYRYVIEGKDEFGKRKRFTKSGFKTQREAKLAAAKAETNLQKNILEKNSYITLYDFIYKCWFPHHQNFIRQSSIYNLETTTLRRIINFFGKDLKLKNVTPILIQKFIDYYLNERTIRRKTVVTDFNYLKMILQYAVDIENILLFNPAMKIQVPKPKKRNGFMIKENNSKLFLEKDELVKFLDLAKQDYFSFIAYQLTLFIALTGVRIGEAQALQWEDIDFENKIAHIRHTWARIGSNSFTLQPPKTQSSIRDIILPDKLIIELKKYRKKYLEFKMCNIDKWVKDKEFVFVARSGTGLPINGFNYRSWLNKIHAKSNGTLPHVYPHMFRHTHISLLAEAGVSLEVICERVGHTEDIITRKIYLHITNRSKQESIKKFNAVIQNF